MNPMEKKMLFVCIPCAKYVDYGFFKSFTQAIGGMMFKWNTALLTEGSSLIVENRNSMARKVLEFNRKSQLKVNYILWLDQDMVFSLEQVEKLVLLLEEHDIVSGLYYNLFGEEEKPLALRRNGEKYSLLSEEEIGKEITEVDAVGFGFMAMRMSVLEKLEKKHGKRIFDMRYTQDGSVISEDQVFCERAKEAGYRIMLDPSILVKHIKGTIPSEKK